MQITFDQNSVIKFSSKKIVLKTHTLRLVVGLQFQWPVVNILFDVDPHLNISLSKTNYGFS